VAALTFTGGPANADPDWNNPLNWDPNQVPMDGDSVVIGDNPTWATPNFNGGQIYLQDLSVGEQSFVPGPGALISVAGSFQWTAGFIADGGTIRVLGQGSVTGDPAYPFRRGPSLRNDCILDVRGTLTISQPGSLPLVGGTPQILNYGTIFFDFGGVQMANAAAVINYGTIVVQGQCGFSGNDITNFGTLAIPADSELSLSGEAILHLVAGGQVTGAGVLQIGFDDQDQGTLSIEADTVLPPELTLNLYSGYISSPSPLSPQPMLQINGKVNGIGGTLFNAHVSLGPTAQFSISGNPCAVNGGQLDNHGVVTILPTAVWNLSSGAQVNNLGRLSLQGDTSIIWGAGTINVANTGLIENLGGLPNKIIGVLLSSTGNIAVKEGALSLVSGAVLTLSGGSIFVNQTTLDSPDNTGSLTLSGGTAGGVLRGTGTVGTAVTNGGWIEPADRGLIFDGAYSQSDSGNIVLPATALNAAAQPVLSFNGPSATFGGTLWCLGPVAPGAANLFNIALSTAQPNQFTKIRVADDNTRLVLNYPAVAGVISAQIVQAPACYGVDFKDYSSAQLLQDLFDNTPFSFLGFYFQTNGHPGRSWLGHAQDLLNQGWALLPIYVGRQQYWPYEATNPNTISQDIPTATQQGTTDGTDAINQAMNQQFPAGSLIFLDIEPTQDLGVNAPPGNQTIAYINAWLSAVGNSTDFVPALYDANSTTGDGNRDAPVIQNSINGNPPTWVSWGVIPGQFLNQILNSRDSPPGVTTASWPVDLNGDVAPVALHRYTLLTGGAWDFANFADVWQFFTDWSPGGTTMMITDQGTEYPLNQISPGGSFDFNVSGDADPARTNGSTVKHDRRARVTDISSSNATIQSGTTVTLTITLDRQAPAPNGTLVLLRCDSSDITIPSSARVPDGSASVAVSATAFVGASATTAQVSSRTLYQLTDAPAITTLTITTS
jgi:hypothetical protein